MSVVGSCLVCGKDVIHNQSWGWDKADRKAHIACLLDESITRETHRQRITYLRDLLAGIEVQVRDLRDAVEALEL